MEQPIPQNSNTDKLPIGWFVLFSLLIHTALLWGVLNNEPQVLMPVAQQPAAGFHITLAPYQVPTQQHQAKPKKSPAKVTKKSNTVTEKTAVSSDNTAAATRTSESAFRERVMVKLRQSIAAHFVYPLLARKRNWQGEVLLSFRLERDGRISGARVAHSSGYGLLDHAALTALAQVERFGEILPHSLTVELPILYRLEG